MCIYSEKNDKIIHLLKQGFAVVLISEILALPVYRLRKYISAHKIISQHIQKTDFKKIASNHSFQQDFLDTEVSVDTIAEKYNITFGQVYYVSRMAGLRRPDARRKENRKKNTLLLKQFKKIHIDYRGIASCNFILKNSTCTDMRDGRSPYCLAHSQICYVNYESPKQKKTA